MKIAIALAKDLCEHAAIAQKMAAAQVLFEHQKTKSYPLGDVGTIVTVSSNDSCSPVPFAYEAGNGNLFFITGLPIVLDGSVKKLLEDISQSDLHSAPDKLKEIDGVSCAFFWDNKARTLLFTTDMLGFQPLYVFEDQEKILLSSELKGIAASGCVPIEMDLGSFGSFITFGNQTGNKTFLKGVQRTEAGSLFLFDGKSRQLNSEKIYDIQWSKRDVEFKDINFEAIDETFNKNILAYKDYGLEAQVLLSGGYDSRQILGNLTNLGIPTKALTIDYLDEPFNPDGKVARKVAKRFGVEHTIVPPPRDHFSSSQYLDFVNMDEVNSPSLYLFATNIERFLSSELRAVWEGVAMGIVLSLDSHNFVNFSEFLRRIPQEGSYHWNAAAKAFNKTTLDKMMESFRSDLENEISKYADDPYGIQEFFLRDRTRGRTSVRPYQVFPNKVLAFTPGVSREFINITLNLPVEYKREGVFRDELFCRYHKRVADVPVGSASFFYLPDKKWYHPYTLMKAKYALIKSPRVREFLRRWRLRKDYYEDSTLVNAVLARIDENHPCLNTESVKHLKEVTWKGHSRALLFYWKIWHMIMTGEIKALKEELYSGK